MAENSNIVTFLMPDGTEVSNDPSYDMRKQREEMLNANPNPGHVGPSTAEQEAQTIATTPASLNSGQPGVGDNATPDDPTKDLHGVLGSPAQQRQVEDVKKAEESGGSPQSTSVEDPEPVDSNKRVAQVRESLAKDREKLTKSTEKLAEKGKEEGDPSTPYSEWEAVQLQHEVNKRNADETRTEENRIVLTSGMTKEDVAKLLQADDDRAGQQNTGGANQA